MRATATPGGKVAVLVEVVFEARVRAVMAIALWVFVVRRARRKVLPMWPLAWGEVRLVNSWIFYGWE